MRSLYFFLSFSFLAFPYLASFIAEHQFHFVPTKRRVRARSEAGGKRMDGSERKRERAKKSEAVEGKKEDSRRFNTR